MAKTKTIDLAKGTNKRHPQTFFARHKRLWKWLGGLIVVDVLLVCAVWLAFQVSPWPSSLLIRDGFDRNSAKVAKALQKYVPSGITQVEDQQYRPNDNDARVDIFYRDHTSIEQPTIVWVHGGAWVSGGKEDIDNYMKILASYGFTTVSVNYSIAPERQYPTPILQLNDALGYLQRDAKRFNIDSGRFILAGDSAGSQIVAQMANIVTNPAYAGDMGIQPKLAATNLKGLLLNCGAYDLALPDYNGPFGSFLHTVLWAYSGTPDFLHDPKLKTASVANYLTTRFPASFITAGNVDPLLAQSTELAQRLAALHVPVDSLFYPTNHEPKLSHEYQFDLDTDDGRRALADMVEFVRGHTH